MSRTLENQYPTPDKSFFQTVADAVHSARANRLHEEFNSDPPALDTPAAHTALLGCCHENAVALAKQLLARGIRSHIVWGALESKHGERPGSVTDAEEQGLVHFWVEIPTPDSEIVMAEIATEHRARDGQPVIYRSLPDHYVSLPASRFVYESWMTPRQLLPNQFENLRSRATVVSETPPIDRLD